MSLAEGVRMALRTELNPNWDRELIRLPAGDAELSGRTGQPTDRPRSPHDRAELTRAAVEAQQALREAARAATAALRACSMATALDVALAGLADAETSRGGPLRAAVGPPGKAALSPREREVLALVAEGHSNRAIAEALFVSPNTVKTHVASLLRKHDASSRAQLAALAAGMAMRAG
ncbi:MAG: putative transcriptional regulator, LuxR family [Thermomicrobiales bacterium]|nr:putative transcriptional regulator, LuxR family [Thermomicrobiales bacterium]